MMHEIFLYTDRVVNMVRPRKLLMMAIDGVAPRAKMNQQRSRRFRSAQEAQDKEDLRLAAIVEWEGQSRPSDPTSIIPQHFEQLLTPQLEITAMGKEVSDEFRNDKGWDSNAITPGTPFMELLAKSLRYWVAKKLNEDPGWAGVSLDSTLVCRTILMRRVTAASHHFRFVGTGRRRTQDYGLYPSTTISLLA